MEQKKKNIHKVFHIAGILILIIATAYGIYRLISDEEGAKGLFFIIPVFSILIGNKLPKTKKMMLINGILTYGGWTITLFFFYGLCTLTIPKLIWGQDIQKYEPLFFLGGIPLCYVLYKAYKRSKPLLTEYQKEQNEKLEKIGSIVLIGVTIGFLIFAIKEGFLEVREMILYEWKQLLFFSGLILSSLGIWIWIENRKKDYSVSVFNEKRSRFATIFSPLLFIEEIEKKGKKINNQSLQKNIHILTEKIITDSKEISKILEMNKITEGMNTESMIQSLDTSKNIVLSHFFFIRESILEFYEENNIETQKEFRSLKRYINKLLRKELYLPEERKEELKKNDIIWD